jgi:hypothetical protein
MAGPMEGARCQAGVREQLVEQHGAARAFRGHRRPHTHLCEVGDRFDPGGVAGSHHDALAAACPFHHCQVEAGEPLGCDRGIVCSRYGVDQIERARNRLPGKQVVDAGDVAVPAKDETASRLTRAPLQQRIVAASNDQG